MRNVRSGFAALAVIGLAAAGVSGQDDGDLLEISAVLEKNDAAAKKAARKEGASQALARLEDVGFLLAGERREKALPKLEALIKDEKVRERGGRLRYSAVMSRSAARKVVLEAAEPEKSYARQQVAIVVEPGAASGWSPSEVDVARAAATDLLRTYRFKVAADEKTAPTVLTLRGGVEVTPHPQSKEMLLVNARGTTARLFERATSLVLAELEVRSNNRGVPNSPPRPGEVFLRTCSAAGEKTVREEFVRDTAKAAVMGIVKRLVEQSAAAGGGGEEEGKRR